MDPDETTAAGPWAADLATYFGENAEAIAAADRYMREKVQPRITELEQGTADARELWKDLNERPEDALYGIVAAVYGDEFADQKYRSLFEAAEEAAAAEAASTTPTAEDEVPAWAKPILEDWQSRRDADLKAKQEAEYAASKKATVEKYRDKLTDDDAELLDAFIYTAGGDMDAAVRAFEKFRDTFAERQGYQRVPPPAEPEAPAVLGTSGATVATPPTAPKHTRYDQLGDALDNVLSRLQQGQTPPPVVG